MKILYTTDCHEDIDFMKNAGEFGLEKKVDLWIANGDFINVPWKLQETFQEYMTTLNELYSQAKNKNFQGSLKDFAKKQFELNLSKELKELGTTYLYLLDIARDGMAEKYKEIAKIFDEIELPSLTLPGNYDSNELMQELFENSLHMQRREIKINNTNLIITGYGGASEWPVWIPQELIVPFKEEFYFDTEGKLIGGKSEAVGFFRENPSDIIITHVPPKNFFDYILNGQSKIEGSTEIHGGNLALSAYLEEMKQENKMPLLWLFGHMHSSVINRGARLYSKTLLINPGSISKNESAVQGTGTFAIIDLEDKKFEKAIIYGIQDNPREIVPIEEYTLTERGLNKLELL